MVSRDVVGAILAIMSAIISNFGVNVQKYSHNRDQLANKTSNTSDSTMYLSRPIWWFGLFLVIFGSAGDFIAFGFATQALVASLGGGTTMVANVVIARYFNKEVLYWSDINGVVCIVIGTLVIAVITEPDESFTLAELEARFVHPKFIVYISVVVLCMLSLLGTIKGSMANKFKNQLRFKQHRQKQLMKGFEKRFQQMEDRVEFLEMALISRTQQIANVKKDKKKKKKDQDAMLLEASDDYKDISSDSSRKIKEAKLQQVDDIMEGLASRDHVPYYYAICAGVVGSISVLLAKFLALMIENTLHGENQFLHPLTYFFLGGMLCSILLQTHLLNMATMLGDTMTVFPIFQAFWISFSVIGGIVFYETDKKFTPDKWFLYPFALFLVAIGVCLLVQHEVKKSASLHGIRTMDFEMPVEDVNELMEEALELPLLPSAMQNNSNTT